MFSRLVATLALVSFVSALPAVDGNREVVKRQRGGTVITDGSALFTGKITNGLWYQSSGLLTSGGCNSRIAITTCWQMNLNQTGNLQRRSGQSSPHAYDPSNPQWNVRDDAYEGLDLYEHDFTNEPDLEKRATTERQRMELYSMPPAPTGSRKLYIWSSYLTPPPTTMIGANYFHLFQLLRRDGTGGPVLYGDAKRDVFYLYDTIRRRNVTIPLENVTGRLVQNRLNVIAGPRGGLNYTMIDVRSGRRLVSYSATGDVGTNSSVKFGLYRALPVPGPAMGYFGDYQVRDF